MEPADEPRELLTYATSELGDVLIRALRSSDPVEQGEIENGLLRPLNNAE